MNSRCTLPGLLALLSLAAAGAAGQEEEPLAPELLTAETIFVRQTLIDPAIVSRFRSELAKGERFRVVSSAEEADLVASLTAEADPTRTLADSGRDTEADRPDADDRGETRGPRPSGTVRVLEDIHLTLVLPDGSEVWKDAAPSGSLTGSAARKLARRLEKRLQEASE